MVHFVKSYCILLLTLGSNCKRIEVQTSGRNMQIINENGINVIDRNSIVFDITTCSDNAFMKLEDRVHGKASFYMVAFSDSINMISVGCIGCQPAAFYPMQTIGPCNTTHGLWVAWDPDGPIRVGQGHVVEERTYMDLKTGNVTDINFIAVSSPKPANWSFIVEDDAVQFLTPSPDGSTIITLPEDTPLETDIINITTTQPEKNITSQVYGNVSQEYFYINGSTLRTRKSFDYERDVVHIVRIITSESVTLTVKVRISDVNDEHPNITCDDVYKLAEEYPVGINIGLPCTVTDADRHDRYNISFEGPDADFFRVENNTSILAAKRLDRDGEDGRDMLSITVVATDLAGHQRRCLLPIKVVGVNDNFPKFSSSVYIVNVTENSTIDVPVLNLTATDGDKPSTKLLVFIHDRDSNDCRFYIEGMTVVLKAGNCDYEHYEHLDKSYSLTLKAKDGLGPGSKTGVAVVVIQVQPRNEHPPYWVLPPSRNETKITSTPELTTLATIKGTTENRAHYSTDRKLSFTSSTSKELSKHVKNVTEESGNSTSKDQYSTTSHTDGAKFVNATFKSTLSTLNSTTITMNTVSNLTNVKRRKRSVHKKTEQTDEFVFPISRVSENASIGTVVYKLLAMDKDSRLHSKLTYNISKVLTDKNNMSTDTFEINKDSGEIMTAKVLDRDDLQNGSAFFIIDVTCSDGEFVINGSLSVQVTEVNEYPPAFNHSIQSVQFVPTSGNKNLVKFEVSDRDFTSNISLYILNETSKFYLDYVNFTWGLYVNHTTKEDIPKELVVIATDQSIPEMTSSTLVVFEQAICEVRTTTKSPSTEATTFRAPQSTVSRTSTKVSSTLCSKKREKERKRLKLQKTGDESEVTVLVAMAIVEGLIMAALLVFSGLVFSGRILKEKNAPQDSTNGVDLDLAVDDELLEMLSEPDIDILADCKDAFPLQDLASDKGKEDDEEQKNNEEKDEEKNKEKEEPETKKEDDSGCGSVPSMSETDTNSK